MTNQTHDSANKTHGMIDKAQLARQIEKALEQVYQTALSAALQAYETATHEETVAEHKYDTFGLEASYLAQGQSKRVEQSLEDLNTFKKLHMRSFNEDTPIHTGAYVYLAQIPANHAQAPVAQPDAPSALHVFIAPISGGIQVTHNALNIQVISPHSPLGKQLLGHYEGDEISLNHKCYELIKVA